MDKKDLKNLKIRYLLWLYKTSKEELDRTERKFTQLEVDRVLIEELRRLDGDRKISPFIDSYRRYMQKKEKEGRGLKYRGKLLRPEYLFLARRLRAVESAVKRMLGSRELARFKSLYEQEMSGRILKSTSH